MRVVATVQLQDGSKAYQLEDGTIVDAQGNVLGRPQKQPSKTDQNLQILANTGAKEGGKQLGQALAGSSTTATTGAATTGGMSAQGSSALVDGTSGGMSVAGSSGGANAGNTTNTAGGAGGGFNYAAALGAGLNAIGNHQAFGQVKDRTETEKGQDLHRTIGLAVGDYYGYGLATPAYHWLMRSKTAQDVEKKLSRVDTGMALTGATYNILKGNGDSDDYHNWVTGGLAHTLGFTGKRTKDYKEERWRNLGRKSQHWKNFGQKQEAYRKANPNEGKFTERDDPTGKYVGQKWSWDAQQDIMRTTGDYRGLIGSLAMGETFKDNWMNTPLEKQHEIVKRLDQEGLLVSNKGDILIRSKDKPRAEEIYKEVYDSPTVPPLPESVQNHQLEPWEQEFERDWAAKQEERRLKERRPTTAVVQPGQMPPSANTPAPQQQVQPQAQPQVQQPQQASSIQVGTDAEGGGVTVNGKPVINRRTNMQNNQRGWNNLPAQQQQIGGATPMMLVYGPDGKPLQGQDLANYWEQRRREPVAAGPYTGNLAGSQQLSQSDFEPSRSPNLVPYKDGYVEVQNRSQPGFAADPQFQNEMSNKRQYGESLRKGSDGIWRRDDVVRSDGGGWYRTDQPLPQNTVPGVSFNNAMNQRQATPGGRDPDTDYIFTDNPELASSGELPPKSMPMGALATGQGSPFRRSQSYFPTSYDQIQKAREQEALGNPLINNPLYMLLSGGQAFNPNGAQRGQR